MSVVFAVFSLWCISCCYCESFLLSLMKTDEEPVIKAISWHSIRSFQHLHLEPKITDISYPRIGAGNKSFLVNATSVKVRYRKSHVNVNPLPLSSLGTQYVVYYDPPFDDYSSLLQLITADSRTEVNITLGIDEEVVFNNTHYKDGQSISTSLEAFQTLSLNTTGAFLGTFIRSSGAIAVFCGAYFKNGTIRSYEQLPPFGFYGNQYAISVDDQTYKLQVISETNGTKIIFNNGTQEELKYRTSTTRNELTTYLYTFDGCLDPGGSIYFNSIENVTVLLSKVDGDFVIVPSVSAYTKISVYSYYRGSVLKVMSDSEVKVQCANRTIENSKTENITGSHISVLTYTLKESETCFIYSDNPFSILEFSNQTGSPDDTIEDGTKESGSFPEEQSLGVNSTVVDSDEAGTICISYNRNMSDVQCYDLFWPKIAILVYGAVNTFLILLTTIVVLCLCMRFSRSTYKQNKRREDDEKLEEHKSQNEGKPVYAKVDKRRKNPRAKNANGGPSSASVCWSGHQTTEYEDIEKICPMLRNADGTYSNNIELRVPNLKTSTSFGKGDYEMGNDRKFAAPRLSTSAPVVPQYFPDPKYVDATKRSLVKRKISDSVLLDKPKPTFSLTDDFKYEEVEGRRASLGNVSRRNERALSDGAAPSGYKPRFEGDGAPVFTGADVDGRTPSMMVTPRKNGKANSDGGTGSEFVPRGPIYSVVEKRKLKSNQMNAGSVKGERAVTVVHIIDAKENVYSLAKM